MKTHRISVLIALGLFLWAAGGAAAPSARPASRPATRPVAASKPATQPSTRAAEVAQRQKLMQLMRRSLELFKEKKYEQVEAVLQEALALDANQPTNLYNMACVKALTSRADQAMDYLERAAENGFTDFLHIGRDPDLVSLRELPRYKALVARKSEIQRAAAQRTVDALKKQLGKGYLFEVDEQARLVFATNTDKETLAALKTNLLIQANSLWQQVFSHRPDQYISVVLPSPEDYRKAVPMPGVGGFYNNASRILFSSRLGQVMVHEFTHALHDADNDADGQQHPIWITEGLAVLFESAAVEDESLRPRDGHRLPYVQAAAKRGKLIPLDKLLTMDQRTFISQAMLAYGQSGSIMLYLHEKDLLRKWYVAFKAGFEKDKSGRASLEQVTGRKLADFEKDWTAWMLKRTPPPTDTGPDGAFLGVRFGQANDGLRVDEVTNPGPGLKAGLKVGDLIVGLDDIEVRDQQSMVPLLKSYRPGDEVTLKVRRNGEYLDVTVKLGRRPPPPTRPATVPATKPPNRPASKPLAVPAR